MRMKISCRWCGRIHEKDYDCGKKPNRDYSTYKRKREEAGRYTYAFSKKSKEIKQASHNLCAVCLYEGILTYDGLETHHIIKLVDAPEKACDDDNLICLCRQHHRMADDGKIPIAFLQELVRRRDSPEADSTKFF